MALRRKNSRPSNNITMWDIPKPGPNDKHSCKYSRSMNQTYPRKCVICGKQEKVKSSKKILIDCNHQNMRQIGCLLKCNVCGARWSIEGKVNQLV